jgi:hypothetical protein
MSLRLESPQPPTVPGPQHYDPEYGTVSGKAATAVFGSESKLPREAAGGPGPAHYRPGDQPHSQTFYFGRARRAARAAGGVGPGRYKLRPFIGMYDGFSKSGKEILYV